MWLSPSSVSNVTSMNFTQREENILALNLAAIKHSNDSVISDSIHFCISPSNHSGASGATFQVIKSPVLFPYFSFNVRLHERLLYCRFCCILLWCILWDFFLCGASFVILLLICCFLIRCTAEQHSISRIVIASWGIPSDAEVRGKVLASPWLTASATFYRPT